MNKTIQKIIEDREVFMQSMNMRLTSIKEISENHWVIEWIKDEVRNN